MNKSFFEMNLEREALIDRETGEILDFDAWQALDIEHDEKIERTALFEKELTAMAAMLRAEEKNIAERRRIIENKIEHIDNLLDRELAGRKFSTAKVEIRYRKSTAVEVDDRFLEYAKANGRGEFIKTEEKVEKSVVKAALAAGEELPFVSLVERNNMSVK